MTTTITSSAPDLWVYGTGPYKTYRLIPTIENPGKLLPYQRVSTFAKGLDLCGVLPQWTAWMALRGAQTPEAGDLPAKVLGVDPDTGKTPIGALDALANLGGAAAKRDRGSLRHHVVALALSGGDLPYLDVMAQRELDAILSLIDSLGDVVAIEAPIVCDEWRVAGSADVILQDRRDGRPIVADLKTGSVRLLQTAIQLVAYARGHHFDLKTQTRTRLVAEGRPRLVMIHAPQDASEPRAIDFDAQRAKAAAELAAQARDLRRKERELLA